MITALCSDQTSDPTSSLIPTLWIRGGFCGPRNTVTHSRECLPKPCRTERKLVEIFHLSCRSLGGSWGGGALASLDLWYHASGDTNPLPESRLHTPLGSPRGASGAWADVQEQTLLLLDEGAGCGPPSSPSSRSRSTHEPTGANVMEHVCVTLAWWRVYPVGHPPGPVSDPRTLPERLLGSSYWVVRLRYPGGIDDVNDCACVRWTPRGSLSEPARYVALSNATPTTASTPAEDQHGDEGKGAGALAHTLRLLDEGLSCGLLLARYGQGPQVYAKTLWETA